MRQIGITFDKRDDTPISPEWLSAMLTADEMTTVSWYPTIKKVVYTTSRSTSEVIESWEAEGFDLDEFHSFVVVNA